jgi:cytidylate kinase
MNLRPHILDPLVIAIDGLTASGKGTIARAIAIEFDLPHMDTGLLYRAVAKHCVILGGDPKHEADARAATNFPPEILQDPELRSEEIGGIASHVSRHASVRQALLSLQREFARGPHGAVLDGRDIGTVVVPDAPIKLFIIATAEARAQRRLLEMQEKGWGGTHASILSDLVARDARDTTRAESPLVMAEDAFVIDTSHKTRDEAIACAIEIVRSRKDN